MSSKTPVAVAPKTDLSSSSDTAATSAEATARQSVIEALRKAFARGAVFRPNCAPAETPLPPGYRYPPRRHWSGDSKFTIMHANDRRRQMHFGRLPSSM